MAAKGKNIIVDHSTLITKLEEEMKNPEMKQDFSKTIGSLKDLKRQTGQDSEMFQKSLTTIVSDMKKIRTYDICSDEFKKYVDAFPKHKTFLKVQEGNGKGDDTGSSQAHSSPKQQRKENQGVNIGSASGPTPSEKSSFPAGKEKDETEKLKNEIDMLKKKLETESRKVDEQSHKMDDRLKQIQEKDNDIKEKEKKIKGLEDEKKILKNRIEEENKLKSNALKDLKDKTDMAMRLEKQANENCTKILELEGVCEKLNQQKSKVEQNAKRSIDQLNFNYNEDKRKFDDMYKKLLAERDDLRDRFSKLAGKKLQEQNADIADLSDPNRAMKLSEKFGQIYDDDWTNAFEYLTDKKTGMQLKEAINVLLGLLQECWMFCNNLMATQMESLESVFLHPAQNLGKFDQRKIVGGLTDRPRITSKDTQSLKDLRRRVGVSSSVIEEVKQALLAASKLWEKEKKGFDKKHTDACAPYLQKCAEICWLMALHDPPLFMKMEVKQGEKLDPNIYTVYSASGTTIDFLVWPPLFNGKDGGLLSKGVAEPLRVVSKKK